MENTIFINAQSGEVECSIVATLNVSGLSYMALLPHTGDSNEMILVRYHDVTDDNIEIYDLSDDEYAIVSKEFNKLMDTLPPSSDDAATIVQSSR